MNNTDEFFKYDLKRVEKFNGTGFHVDCDADLFVDLDDEWHVNAAMRIVKQYLSLKLFT